MRERDPFVHRLSRRDLLRGAAGLGHVAATDGSLLPSCGSGGDAAEGDAAGPVADGPPEIAVIRLHATFTASCIAAEYMAEPFIQEEGFTEVLYRPIAPGKWVEGFARGEIDIGVAYAAALIPKIERGGATGVLKTTSCSSTIHPRRTPRVLSCAQVDAPVASQPSATTNPG